MGSVIFFQTNGNINFSAIGTDDSFTTIATGLPKPIAATFVSFQVFSSSGEQGVLVRVDTSGNLSINNSKSAKTGTSTYCGITATYIVNE